MKTLAQVRRLQVPLCVQVNLAADGGQQVNVASLDQAVPEVKRAARKIVD